MIGRTLSHYRIEQVLGQGGMGTVYLAHDAQLGRKVAIKVISDARPAGEDLRARLLREARAASRLSHPNVVTVYEVGQADGVDFIAMEHVEGRPLAGLVRPGGLPLPQVLDVASQLTAAMAAAHAQHVVHRDLKPSNVLVTPGGQVKVLDMGLARRVEPREAGEDEPTRTQLPTGLTTAGAMLGTIGYMAPEQIEGRPADERSDVFAIGVILYELLTGRRPFAADTPMAELAGALAAAPPPLRSSRPDAPAELERIVARCLEKPPGARYPSAAELARDLERLAPRAPAPSRPARSLVALIVALALVAVAAVAWLLVNDSRQRWARETAPDEIARLTAHDDLVGAYVVARKALAFAPNDARLQQLIANLTVDREVNSDPPGADVAVGSFALKAGAWVPLGRTPMPQARVPFGLVRWRLTKPGYDTLYAGEGPDLLRFALVRAGTAPAGMVRVPRGAYQIESANQDVEIPGFWLDRYEVTNRQYKAFVDAGGYRDPKYWKEPFVRDGRRLAWARAMALFRDATGQPGPATWKLGGYPDGEDDYPVGGVSWFEAAAYAEFAGKQLPTAYHWYRGAGANSVFSEVIDLSNFADQGPVAVGSSGGLGPYGTYDMAGNVKEWCANATPDGRRYILGGGWNEAAYMFHDEDAQSPFERRSMYGFRCMRADSALAPLLGADIRTFEPDPAKLQPVGDALFEAYRHLYDYDPAPLDVRVEHVDDSDPAWRKETVTVRAAYGNERLPLYVFLPRSVPPPWQAVVFFPGSNAVWSTSSKSLRMGFTDFYIRAGRALVYPVYQGTYERRVPGPPGRGRLRDIMIERGKDVRRAVDYLVSRRDVDSTRIAFAGMSLGAQLGPLFLAIEPRFRAGVLFSGGFETWDMPPESDPVNFAPRVRQPVLMVNGREDFDLPYATSQVPMFRMLGTPEPGKRHVVLEGGHIPPHPEQAIRVILEWLDARLGPVR